MPDPPTESRPAMPTATKLIETIYEHIKTLPGAATPIQLRESVYQLITDDSDWHRTRQGFMEYQEVVLLTTDQGRWLIGCGNGEACGCYPLDPYGRDLLALRLPDGVSPESWVAHVPNSAFFYRSLCYSMRSAWEGFYFPKTATFGRAALYGPSLIQTVRQLPPEVFSSDLKIREDYDNVSIRLPEYPAGLVDILMTIFLDVLATTPEPVF